MLIHADARHLPLRDKCVQCVVTSPPYWGLRDYQTAPLVWGGERCEHEWGDEQIVRGSAQKQGATSQRAGRANVGEQIARGNSQGCWCARCGAWRGSLGLEPTPELYVAHLVEVFRELRRVLKDDATVFVNLGDSYWGGKGENGSSKARATATARGYTQSGGTVQMSKRPQDGRHDVLKPKDLVGIPWRVAFALQADGWWLRSEIIWAKAHEFCAGGVGSSMPESVTDRPTRAHETIFLLTKSAKYYYDGEAVKQDGVYPAGTRAAKGSGTREGNRRGSTKGQQLRASAQRNDQENPSADGGIGYANYSGKRNLRDVWSISPTGYSGAHFATFSQKLVEPCILAGSTYGDLVLDPFIGSGTVGLVAERLGRRWVGTDLAYQSLAKKRTAQRGIRFDEAIT